MKKEKITLIKILNLNLKYPIMVERKQDNKKFSLYYKPFKIYATGSTFDNCLKDFQEQLYLLYKFYSNKLDNELSKEALELKYKVLDLIELNASG